MLNKCLKRAARIILQCAFLTPSADMFSKLNWLSFSERVKYRKTTLVFKWDEGLEYLLQTMNAVIDEGMPLSWRKSEISPLFKGKGSVLECGNYRGIKLMAHTMKLYERIIDRRIREIV